MARQRIQGSWTDELYKTRTKETLGVAAQIFRDLFIREYIKDFNPVNALLRAGWENPKTASGRSSQLLRETYVQVKLDEMIRQLQPTDIVQRGQVMAKMWYEANNDKNDGHARIAATAHVAKMLGMDKPKEETPDAQIAQGVMLVPMLVAGDWQETAATAQALLKANVTAPMMAKPVVPPPPAPQPAKANV